MPETIPADTTVVLTADITLDKQITKVEGVLDGHGHTITVGNMSIIGELTGTVQNLGVIGTEQLVKKGMFDPSFGAIAVNLNGGKILNSFVQADIKATIGDDQGGFAGTSLKGEIHNCYYAGTAAGGGAGAFISKSNDPANPSVIMNSYYASAKKSVGFGNGYNENEASVAQKELDFMKTAAFAELLNTDAPNTGYHWEVLNGQLPTLVEGRPEGTPDANTEKLNAAIKEAKALVETKYTPETWAALKSALDEAEKTIKNSAATQGDIDAAETALRNAIAGLQEKPVEIATEAVALPADGVIEIASQDDMKGMTAASTKGKFYRLVNDIVIDTPYWYGTSFAGVLEGDGHTITIKNKMVLFESIDQGAVIQNVGFLGEVVGSGMDIGGVATDSSGLIVNCWNRMTVTTEGNNNVKKDAGAFVAHLRKGGAIVNCYAAGKVFAKGSTGTGVAGAFAATSEDNTLVKNGMFLNTTAYDAVGNAAGQVVNCTSQKRGGFYSQENLAALNANRGAYGKEWTIDNDGWFHLGAAGNFDPSIGAGMRFTFAPVYNRAPVDFSSGDGLELSLGDFLLPAETEGDMPKYVGYFTNPNFDGEIACVPEYTAVGQGNHNVMVSQDCGLNVQDAGSVTVHVMDKASWSGTGFDKELTSFTIVITPIKAEEVRLVPHGKYVDPAKNTVAGSGNVVVQGQVKVDGQWKKTSATMFSFGIEGYVFGEGDGFYAQAPGEITITAKGFGMDAKLVMTSTYVPVTYIMPFPNGLHWIHGRNANSNKLGDFLDLELADHTGRVDVRPENASYRNLWKMESSDPKIAEYIPDFLLAVLPYKAGKVTLTATSLDPQLKEPVTGSTELELRYLNPVTAVAVNPEELDEAHYNAETQHITLTGTEEILLPIHFTGTKAPEMAVDPNDGVEKEFSWHVSEPEMIWSQEGDGEVEIVRNGNLGMFVKSPLEYCVANDVFKITGVTNGTVTVTGVPMDKTNKVEPVTFTVEVTGVVDPEPYDVRGFINSAKPSAINGVKSGITYKCGSDEWQVLSLLRAGETLPQDQLDAYYQSVVETVATWKPSRKPTEYERVALALSAMGKDITDVGGINLAERIYNHKYLSDGSNEVAFALLALDARNTPIPEGAKNTRDSMLELLLSFQNEDGGFGLAPGSSSGADTTSMSLQALAPYQDRPEVAAAIENGLVYLKNEVHTKPGHFDQGTVEANAQTIIAMAVLGRDLLAEPDFYSARYNLMSAMSPYHVPGEGFKHTAVDPKINSMATAQALQALDAYERFLDGKAGYWDFTDTAAAPEINPDGHAVAEVMNLIHKLPEAADVAERDAKAIQAARAAYDALTPEQQALVNADRLIAAEEALANLGKPDPDKEAAKAVMDLIEKLPAEIKLENKAEVQAARDAYDKLTAEQQKLVTNLQKLEAAEAKIKELEGGDKPEPQPETGNVVYIDVERFAIGQGFITEPVAVEFTEGQSYADIIDKVLGDRASIRDNHNYLEMIRGANLGVDKVQIPDYIVELSKNKKGEPTCTTEIVKAYYQDRGFEAWPEGDLGEFTYSAQAGWVYSVNDIYPEIGIGENKAKAGDVIRLQYTVFGLGKDVQDPSVTNMDNLVKAMAIVNADNPVLKEDEVLKAAYAKAVEVMADMVHPKADVDATAEALLKALEDAKKEKPEELVQKLIDALPEADKITAKDQAAVEAARKAFNELDAETQKKINTDKLVAAEKALDTLAAAEVEKLIEALPKEITLKDKEAVEAARAAYGKLTDTQKKLVKNLQKLTDAEKALDALAAAEVEKLIDALPEKITLNDKKAIEEARKAYTALTDDQKALVKNLGKLDKAELALKELEETPVPVESVTDPATKVSLTAPGLTSDMELAVRLLGADDNDVKLMRKEIPSSKGLIKVYNVKLIRSAAVLAADGIQLSGKAKLSLAVDKKYEGKTLDVLFVGEDGKVEKMSGKVANGAIELEVDELGSFGVVVDVKAPTPGGNGGNGGGNGGGKGPAKTGDEMPLGLMVGTSVMSLAALAVLAFLQSKKRKF